MRHMRPYHLNYSRGYDRTILFGYLGPLHIVLC
uniref:Uncharacterized protein n=1 Tax=Arundo donax TaxID=35708 RepID=A0A0A8YBC0_ARUDO